MNYVSIGTSWITEKFISAAKTVKDFNLYGVYSRDIKRAEDFRIKNDAVKSFSSLQDIAEDPAVNAVYIASPNLCHYEQSRFFLMNGKNVICEKPATTTLTEMEELYSLAEDKGLIYTEAIMSIHTKAFDIVKEEMKSLGIIRSAHLDYCQLSSKYGLFLEGKNPNIFNPEMHTGCLMDIGVYNLYIAAALFGMPEKILSDSVKLVNGCDGAGCAILRYKDFSVTLNYSKTGQSYSQSEIIGDKATLLISSVSQLTGIRKCSKETETEIIPEDISRDIIMAYEAVFFRDMCNNRDYNNEEYRFSKDTAFTVRRICDIIRQQNDFPF